MSLETATLYTVQQLLRDWLFSDYILILDKNSKESGERGCGALGAAGTLGGKFVNWIQGQPFLLWEGSVCFTKPGDSSSEAWGTCLQTHL